ISAPHAVGGMCTSGPMPHAFVAGMTTLADPIGGGRRNFAQPDNLADITLDMQASGAMTVFALDSLLRMEGVAEILGCLRVTGRAGVSANAGRAGNLRILLKILFLLVRGFGLAAARHTGPQQEENNARAKHRA